MSLAEALHQRPYKQQMASMSSNFAYDNLHVLKFIIDHLSDVKNSIKSITLPHMRGCLSVAESS